MMTACQRGNVCKLNDFNLKIKKLCEDEIWTNGQHVQK